MIASDEKITKLKVEVTVQLEDGTNLLGFFS
jgi:hypothetical protein